MFFRTQSKIDSQTKEMYIYYRLVESSRDIVGDTRARTILSVGRMEGIKPQQLWAIADGLNARYRCEPFLFPEESPVVEYYVNLFWERLVSEKKLDIVRDIQRKESMKDWQKIDMQSINNTSFLHKKDFIEQQILSIWKFLCELLVTSINNIIGLFDINPINGLKSATNSTNVFISIFLFIPLILKYKSTRNLDTL